MSRKKAEAQPAPEQPEAVTVPEIRQEPRVLTMAPAGQPISALVPQAPPSPEEVLQVAENQIKIRRGYVKLVAASLRPEDVLVFGEEVYLPAKPCQDILSWARIRVKPHWPVEEHHYNSPDGEFIEFVITATIMDTGGREVDVMGNRSTRDEFFGISGKDYVCPTCQGPTSRRKANPGDKWDSNFCDSHGKVKPEVIVHYLPLYDVDIPSVRSAAVTNLWNKSLKAIGLMPTIQDLEQAGMDISRVKRVDFKGDSKKSSPQSSPPPKQPQPTPKAQPAVSANPPAQASSEAQTTGLPKASIPPAAFVKETKKVAGGLQSVRKGVAQNKQQTPYRVLKVHEIEYFLFDNREMQVNGKEKLAVFQILDAARPNCPVDFVIESNNTSKGVRWNVIRFLMIDRFEWEEDGTPVLRRDPPSRGDAFEPGDNDLPEGFFDS